MLSTMDLDEAIQLAERNVLGARRSLPGLRMSLIPRVYDISLVIDLYAIPSHHMASVRWCHPSPACSSAAKLGRSVEKHFTERKP